MIDTLLMQMTVEEKLGQLTMIRADLGALTPGEWNSIAEMVRRGRAGAILDLKDAGKIAELQRVATGEGRLGIPLIFALDVLHGFDTIFPVPLGEACAFDEALWQATAKAAAEEAAAAGISLTFAPMLDASRDPRWGRMVEGPGEDPFVGARFAKTKVRGFQGEDLSAATAIGAVAKHFVGYGAVTAGRDYNSVDLSALSLNEVHLPPFAAAVEENVAAVMPALCDLAGVPLTAHRGLLRDVLRQRWGFDGVVISDFGAIKELICHGVANDVADAAALALAAGVDIDMVSGAYMDGLPEALARGLVSRADIDAAVRRVLLLKMRLGLFAAPFARGAAAPAPERKRRHLVLAREAAVKSIVLLKNKGSILPLGNTIDSLAVIGPFAHAPRQMLGPWPAAGAGQDAVSFFDGLRAAMPWARIASGEDASAVPVDARVVVLCLGEPAETCGEASSRAAPIISDDQRRLAEAVLALGKPVIAVITCGRPLIAPWLFEAADAALITWFLGHAAGAALADVLTGAVAPSGKLAVSWPHAIGQIPLAYASRPTGRPADPSVHDTSKYLDAPIAPQFPFGHGLSTTTFAYENLRLSTHTLAPGDRLAAEIDVINTGKRAATETVFVFIRDRVALPARPVLELKGFRRISLGAGERGCVRFEISTEMLAAVGEDGVMRLEAGEFDILIGPKAERGALLRATVRLIDSAG